MSHSISTDLAANHPFKRSHCSITRVVLIPTMKNLTARLTPLFNFVLEVKKIKTVAVVTQVDHSHTKNQLINLFTKLV